MKCKPLWALLALAACTAGQTSLAVQGQATGGQLAYGAPTLADAKRGFFGDPGGSGGGNGSNSLLGGGDTVVLHGAPPTVTALTLTRSNDLGGGIVLEGTALAGFHHLSGTLPNGFGVLTDPIQIDMWAQSLSLQMVLGQSRALPAGWQLEYGAGLGVSYVSAATHLQSALLDVRGHSAQTLPYAMAETRLSGRKGPALLGSLWVFYPSGTELRLGLEQAF